MWIKICANTNLDDALLAAELGADALGFVFATSTRNVTAERVAAITSQLPATVEKIGVFSTQDSVEIAAAIRTAGLTGAQLHSGYNPDLVAALIGEFPGLRVIQTIHWNVASSESRAEATMSVSDVPEMAALNQLKANQQIAAVLVDSRTATASGGTGVAFDWNAAQQNLAALTPKPLIVAGGLTPENVQQAIAALRPWGVDVASGVEAGPGRKDPARLKSFLTNARKALR
jgi:phosphoribosylanthranilate isomerase